MRKSWRAMSGLSIAAVLTWALPLQGNASINVDDTHISLMVQEDEWHEVSDKETLHTFTNGEDVITVLKYGAGAELPAPARPDGKYEAVYQTYYSTEDITYVVTGSAAEEENMDEVREIIGRISYTALLSESSSQATQEEKSQNSGTVFDGTVGQERNDGITEEENPVSEQKVGTYPGADVVELVNLKGDTTTAYKLEDGRYMDRIDRIFVFDGVGIWTDENGVEWNEAVN